MTADTTTRTPNRAGWSERLQALPWPLFLTIVLLVLFFSYLYPDTFATTSNAENVARQGAILLVVAIGQTFVLLVGGFDISVGANMGFTSTVAAKVMLDHGLVEGLVAGLVAGTIVGLVNGVFIAKVGVNPFVMTLAMMTFLSGFANEISDGASIFGLPSGLKWFGRADWGPLPSTVGIGLIVLVLGWVVLNHTRIGLYIYAIGGSRDTSRLAGVRVVRYEIAAYTICGALAGVGGIMVASRVSVGQAGLGSGYELLSIATAVIGGVAIGGGVGRLSGVVLGVVLLSVMSTGMNIAGWSQFIQQMITGVILVAAVVVDLRRGRGWPWSRRRGLATSTSTPDLVAPNGASRMSTKGESTGAGRMSRDARDAVNGGEQTPEPGAVSAPGSE